MARTDEIVRPGVNLNPADTSYGEQVLQPGRRDQPEALAAPVGNSVVLSG